MPSLLLLLTCSNPVGCQAATTRTSALLEKYFSRPHLVINDVTLEGRQQHSCRQIAHKRSKMPEALGAAASLLSPCPTQSLWAVIREKTHHWSSEGRSQLMDWESSVREENEKGGKERKAEERGIQLWSFWLCHWKQSYSWECHLVCLSQNELGQQNVPYKLCQLWNRLQNAYTNSFTSTQIPAHLSLQPFPEKSLTLWFFFKGRVTNFLSFFFDSAFHLRHKTPLLLYFFCSIHNEMSTKPQMK